MFPETTPWRWLHCGAAPTLAKFLDMVEAFARRGDFGGGGCGGFVGGAAWLHWRSMPKWANDVEMGDMSPRAFV